jgi:hypothetical protein
VATILRSTTIRKGPISHRQDMVSKCTGTRTPTRWGTKNWYGYYWARRTEEGDYEIRSVPSTLGEHSVPGGVMPKEGFKEHYERVSS